MTGEVQRRRGRPPTGRAMPPAERARRYRARLRMRGVRVRSVQMQDRILGRVQFGRDTFLTPGEQDVLRRFCAKMRELPRLPHQVAVFGSRARGDSHARSDLDVAVLAEGPRDRSFESALSAISLIAQRPYWFGEYGIWLRPVPFYTGEQEALLEAIKDEMEVVWTRL